MLSGSVVLKGMPPLWGWSLPAGQGSHFNVTMTFGKVSIAQDSDDQVFVVLSDSNVSDLGMFTNFAEVADAIERCVLSGSVALKGMPPLWGWSLPAGQGSHFNAKMTFKFLRSFIWGAFMNSRRRRSVWPATHSSISFLGAWDQLGVLFAGDVEEPSGENGSEHNPECEICGSFVNSTIPNTTRRLLPPNSADSKRHFGRSPRLRGLQISQEGCKWLRLQPQCTLHGIVPPAAVLGTFRSPNARRISDNFGGDVPKTLRILL